MSSRSAHAHLHRLRFDEGGVVADNAISCRNDSPLIKYVSLNSVRVLHVYNVSM